jgi:small conductance mechanosensitive channel
LRDGSVFKGIAIGGEFKMLRSTSKLQLMTVGLVGVMNGSAYAVDAGKAGQEGGKAIAGIIETITTAFKGGEAAGEAQRELVKMAGTVCLALGLLVISYMVASAIGRFIGKIVTDKVDVTLGKFLSKAVRNMIMLVVVMVALEMNEVSITGFAAILAALGFAIGMALQGTLGNFAAGIMLLVFRPFKVGDYIVVADTEGTVEEIDLFTTRLNALDNRHLIVPNGEIFGAKLENYTRNELRRVDVNVGADYGASIDETRAVLTRAAEEVYAAFPAGNAPDVEVYLVELGASSVDWQLRVWSHPKNYWAVRQELTAAAKNSMDAANISIPFPQMNVHVGGQVVTKARAA